MTTSTTSTLLRACPDLIASRGRTGERHFWRIPPSWWSRAWRRRRRCRVSVAAEDNNVLCFTAALDIYESSTDAKGVDHSAPSARENSDTGTATSASSRTRPAPFDFVLMDISMPIMDGMEATRRIRGFEKEHGLKKTTIIALTGLASEKARDEAETVGIDIFLPKPVKFKELKTLLEMETKGIHQA